METKTKNWAIVKWLVWSLSVTFYFYEFVLRVAPSVMVKDLMAAFSLNAAEVGSLAAIYLYIYAPMQIPVGVLTDYFGARKLLTIAAIVCGLGCLLFGFANQEWIAGAGRLLMGIGSAFAFVGMVYICSHWFHKKNLAFLIGLANSLGMFGAFIGQGPLSMLVHEIGWRASVIQLGILGIIIGAVIFFVVRNDPPSIAKKEQAKREKMPSVFHFLKVVARKRQSWINALASLCYYSITVAFAGLWGIPFLEQTHDVSRNVASFATSMIFVGWMIGGPIIGTYSDRIKGRKPILLTSLTLTFISLASVIYLDHLPLIALFILLFAVGFFSSAQLLQYSIAIEMNPHEAKGSSIAFTNFLTMMGGAIIQPLVGYLLDLNWHGERVLGIPYYSTSDYKIALSIFPILVIFAMIFNLLIKEKKAPHLKDPDLPI